MFRFDARDSGQGVGEDLGQEAWDDEDHFLLDRDGDEVLNERSRWEAEVEAVWAAEANGRGGWWIGEDTTQKRGNDGR